MGAETGLHADDARGQPFEGLNERQSLDLAAESDLAAGVETDDVEDFLANVDADRCQGCGGHGLLLRMLQGSLCRLSPWGKQPVHPISGHSGLFMMSSLR